ncbi:MAG: MBOAT family O-acyltransferase [Pseudomonadales bacterium]
MLFNSLEFALFFVATLCGYYVLARKPQNIWLLVASYMFYGWWDWRFLSLIMLSTVVDFNVAQYIEKTVNATKRKRLLFVSLVANLGLLATFKYFNFFIDSFVSLGASVGLNFDTPALRLVPPVGISFYTFQTLSYTIDVYRRNARAERSFFTFALFVSYFPQLVAGPIERAQRLLPQLHKSRRVTLDYLSGGLLLILIGLFKKVVIADTAGIQVDDIFSDPAGYTTWTLWKGAILFAIQIYGDFSGYSNMARGISLLLGIRLVENFKTPYFARNVSEFWRRWHISLSQWLRDYLYISLGGNRGGAAKTYRNLMLTMLLGGLWHGASWTFVIWGFLHGLYLVVHQWWERLWQIPSLVRLPNIPGVVSWLLSIGLTFSVVVIAFVIFRAESIGDAWIYIVGMFEGRGEIRISDIAKPAILVLALLPIDIMQYYNKGDLLAVRWLPLLLRAPLYAGMFLAVLLVSNNEIPFIYFQF